MFISNTFHLFCSLSSPDTGITLLRTLSSQVLSQRKVVFSTVGSHSRSSDRSTEINNYHKVSGLKIYFLFKKKIIEKFSPTSI